MAAASEKETRNSQSFSCQEGEETLIDKFFALTKKQAKMDSKKKANINIEKMISCEVSEMNYNQIFSFMEGLKYNRFLQKVTKDSFNRFFSEKRNQLKKVDKFSVITIETRFFYKTDIHPTPKNVLEVELTRTYQRNDSLDFLMNSYCGLQNYLIFIKDKGFYHCDDIFIDVEFSIGEDFVTGRDTSPAPMSKEVSDFRRAHKDYLVSLHNFNLQTDSFLNLLTNASPTELQLIRERNNIGYTIEDFSIKTMLNANARIFIPKNEMKNEIQPQTENQGVSKTETSKTPLEIKTPIVMENPSQSTKSQNSQSDSSNSSCDSEPKPKQYPITRAFVLKSKRDEFLIKKFDLRKPPKITDKTKQKQKDF